MVLLYHIGDPFVVIAFRYMVAQGHKIALKVTTCPIVAFCRYLWLIILQRYSDGIFGASNEIGAYSL